MGLSESQPGSQRKIGLLRQLLNVADTAAVDALFNGHQTVVAVVAGFATRQPDEELDYERWFLSYADECGLDADGKSDMLTREGGDVLRRWLFGPHGGSLAVANRLTHLLGSKPMWHAQLLEMERHGHDGLLRLAREQYGDAVVDDILALTRPLSRVVGAGAAAQAIT